MHSRLLPRHELLKVNARLSERAGRGTSINIMHAERSANDSNLNERLHNREAPTLGQLVLVGVSI